MSLLINTMSGSVSKNETRFPTPLGSEQSKQGLSINMELQLQYHELIYQKRIFHKIGWSLDKILHILSF